MLVFVYIYIYIYTYIFIYLFVYLHTCVNIRLYIYIYIHNDKGHLGCAAAHVRPQRRGLRHLGQQRVQDFEGEKMLLFVPAFSTHAVGFHNLNLRIVDLRVSNPNKLIVDVFLTRCRISMCQGLGPKKHDEISEIDREQGPGALGPGSERAGVDWELRPFFILRIVRPRIFESTFRNHCAKKSDGALRKSTSFV